MHYLTLDLLHRARRLLLGSGRGHAAGLCKTPALTERSGPPALHAWSDPKLPVLEPLWQTAKPVIAKPTCRGLWSLLTVAPVMVLVGSGPVAAAPANADSIAQTASCPATNSELSLLSASPHETLLKESWEAYRQRFIQADGRVIDREASDRTVSEGQAYAMWRAVVINDRDTFDRVYAWAENNLARREGTDHLQGSLWAWHWGRHESGQWQILDSNFAVDADIDAAMALILAARRWNCPAYLEAARTRLADIWQYSTVVLPDGTRQLLPGPADAFWNQPNRMILNPSYFSPYAYRLFAQVDPERNWQALVDSGYTMLEASSALSPVGLPSDWIAYDPASGTYSPLPTDSAVQSRYSFDAFRVWWRVGLDLAWYGEPRARDYLSTHLDYLEQRWRRDRKLPAVISLAGEDLADYEATAQYAMLYPALQQVSPLLALQIYRQKLLPAYRNGFWDSDSAYYTQNLAWFALLPKTPPSMVFQRAVLPAEPSQRGLE